MPREKRQLPVHLVKMEVELPGYEGWWARFRTDILVGDVEILSDVESWTTGSWKLLREIFSRYVEDWNFLDRRGRKLPRPFGKPEVFKDLVLDLFYWLASALVEAPRRGLPLPETAEASPLTSGELSSAETSAGLPKSLEV